MILLAVDFENLHQILQKLYLEMTPLCKDMTGVAKGIAGLGALFYVAYRVWQQLSRAEPIDVFPLLRPFAIGFAIMFFPTVVLGTINSVMSPIVKGANQMVKSQTLDMEEHRQLRDKLEYEAYKRNPEKAYLVDKEDFDKKLAALGTFDAIEKCGLYLDRAAFNAKKALQGWFKELLELLFQAAALVIDVIRTFFLIVLAILGPIAFALSVWDGFGSSLTQWITRYLSVYLWLPVSDIFSSILAKIQVLMLKQDIEMLSDKTYIPDGSSAVYIIFMLIGIVGYFTVPSVANWIISAGGMGSLGKNVNSAAVKGGAIAGGLAGAAAGNITGRLKSSFGGGGSSSEQSTVNGSRSEGGSGSQYGENPQRRT